MKLNQTFSELILSNPRFSTINLVEDFRDLRESLKNYGVERFKMEMIHKHHFTVDGKIDPVFNPFAKILSGQLKVAYSMDLLAEQGLGIYSKRYFIAKNTPEYDRNWNNIYFIGSSSMSLHHELLLIKNPQWNLFNVLTLGITPDFNLQKSLKLLNEMEHIALRYAESAFDSTNIGLYFHAFPTNSVQSLHLHIVDLNHTGPSFYYCAYKNLSLAAVRDQLEAESACPDVDIVRITFAFRARDPPLWQEAEFPLARYLGTLVSLGGPAT